MVMQKKNRGKSKGKPDMPMMGGKMAPPFMAKKMAGKKKCAK